MSEMEDQCDILLHMPTLQRHAEHADIVIEIGVGNGNGSTRAFDRGLRVSKGWLIGVDIDPERPQCKPGCHWTMVHGASEDPSTVAHVINLLEGEVPDIIFIDTVHVKEHMEKELAIWSKLAHPKQTIWLFHDTWMFGPYNAMTDAIKEFCEAHPEWEYEDITRESHGLGLMKGRMNA